MAKKSEYRIYKAKLKADTAIQKANIEEEYKQSKMGNRVVRKSFKLKRKEDRKTYKDKIKNAKEEYKKLVRKAKALKKEGKSIQKEELSPLPQPFIEEKAGSTSPLFAKPEDNPSKDYTTVLTTDQLLDLEKAKGLPSYSHGEEVFNSVTHIVGGGLGVIALIAGLLCSFIFQPDNKAAAWSMGIFGVCIILLYTMSAIYHGLHVSLGKKVFQIIDHCTVFLLVIGTYVPVCLILLKSIAPWNYVYLAILIALDVLGIVLYATIKNNKFVSGFAQFLYIATGWSVIFFYPVLYSTMSLAGLWLIIGGGISYTVGAIFFSIGINKPYFHSIFHLFVLLGTILQYLGILLFGIIGI